MAFDLFVSVVCEKCTSFFKLILNPTHFIYIAYGTSYPVFMGESINLLKLKYPKQYTNECNKRRTYKPTHVLIDWGANAKINVFVRLMFT